MQILVASSSPYRRKFYRDAIEASGHEVSVVQGGIDCLHSLRTALPHVLVLETPLLWGGSDGVLDVFQQESKGVIPPVILVDTGCGTVDWFQLGRFRIDDFFFRVPAAHELRQAIASVSGQRSAAPRSVPAGEAIVRVAAP